MRKSVKRDVYHSYVFRNDGRNYINVYLRLLNINEKLKIPYSRNSPKSNKTIVDTQNRYPSHINVWPFTFVASLQALNKQFAGKNQFHGPKQFARGIFIKVLYVQICSYILLSNLLWFELIPFIPKDSFYTKSLKITKVLSKL